MSDTPRLPIIWSRQAVQDLGRIRAYIGEFAPLAAQRFAQRLVSTVESLGEQPNRGRPVRLGVRELVFVRPYLILYEVTEDAVYIVHIRHGARRPD